MNPDLIQPIITIASVFAAFVWLRNDLKSQRADLQK